MSQTKEIKTKINNGFVYAVPQRVPAVISTEEKRQSRRRGLWVGEIFFLQNDATLFKLSKV